jgi:transcriptional regulator NrdR family protein
MQAEELISDDGPTCPFCGHHDTAWWDTCEPIEDGQTVDHPCPSCCRDYSTTMYVTTTFNTPAGQS